MRLNANFDECVVINTLRSDWLYVRVVRDSACGIVLS